MLRPSALLTCDRWFSCEATWCGDELNWLVETLQAILQGFELAHWSQDVMLASQHGVSMLLALGFVLCTHYCQDPLLSEVLEAASKS